MPNEQLVEEFIERGQKILRSYPILQGNRPIARGLKDQIKESVTKFIEDVREARARIEEADNRLVRTLDNIVDTANARRFQYQDIRSSDGGRRKSRRGKKTLRRRKRTSRR